MLLQIMCSQLVSMSLLPALLTPFPSSDHRGETGSDPHLSGSTRRQKRAIKREAKGCKESAVSSELVKGS